jgi:hypothetical protein
MIDLDERIDAGDLLVFEATGEGIAAICRPARGPDQLGAIVVESRLAGVISDISSGCGVPYLLLSS